MPSIPEPWNCHPKRPLQKPTARSASFEGSSKWTIRPGIAPPFWRSSAEAIRSGHCHEGRPMVRVTVVYEEIPDPARYEQHATLCRQVPGVTFRHGKVFGAPFGEPAFQ